jgi:putative DNA primase/helicase
MTALDAALACIARGWNPVRVAFRKKNPLDRGWQNKRISKENAAAHFGADPMNVGVQLGSNSGGLTDIDLDCPEAVTIAAYLLPRTQCLFGRKSKRQSHRFYKTSLCETITRAVVQFKDPTSDPKQSDSGGEDHKHVLLEVRIGGGEKGAQTLVPGSVHESGEAYEFESGCDGEPAAVDGAALMTAAKQVAAGSLVARYWPGSGKRHDARLAVAGLLVLTDFNEAWANLFVEAVARAAGDPDIDDARSAVKSTFAKNADGGSVTGLPFAREIFGDAVANKVSEWLGCRARRETESPNKAIAPDNEIDSTFARLASLSRVEYDRVRSAEAARLDIRVSTLDFEVDRRRAASDEIEGSGRPLSLTPPEPWPSPVEGAELIGNLERTINDHVKLSGEAAVAVALWCLHAHALEASFFSPRLAITSPEKRCGKTTLLRIIEALTPKSLSASNITAAALFRTVEKVRPTLLIDEADTFLNENEELRGIINSGHARDGRVIRLVGDDHEPREFSTFCPTAIAAIGAVPGTIEDRSISVEMRRKKKDETVSRFRADRSGHFQELNRKAVRWIADNLDSLRELDPAVPPELHDRAADNWRPLLAITDLAGGDWPARARRAALKLSGADAGEGDTTSTLLLEDIRVLFRERDVDRLKSEELTTALSAMLDRPWPTFDRGRSISAAGIARLLKPYGIIPGTIRTGTETARGYLRSAFEDAFSRYLPP